MVLRMKCRQVSCGKSLVFLVLDTGEINPDISLEGNNGLGMNDLRVKMNSRIPLMNSWTNVYECF